MNTRNYHAFVLIGTLALLNVNEPCCADELDCVSQLIPDREASGMRARLTDVKLLGTAKGGELFLLEIRNPNPRYVGIKTQPGEPAESVLARLGAAVLDTRAFNPHQAWTVHAEGNLLKSFPGSPGSYVFAGTETGLGIPPPPTSLTAAYDQEKQEVCLTWENPAEPYDGIGGSVGSQPGTATTVAQHWSVSERPAPRNESGRIEDRRNKGLCRFYIIGCRDGVISSPAVITWDYDDNSQSELDVPPFFGGVSANWKPWSYGG